MSDEKWEPTKEELQVIAGLADKLQAAKNLEAAAKQTRITIESKLAVLIPSEKEGQKTVGLPDKRKVTVKRGLIYNVNLKELDAVDWDTIGIAPPIESKTTRYLHAEGYKWYEKNMPEVFAQIAKHVEVKPKKTAVTVSGAPAAKKGAKAKE